MRLVALPTISRLMALMAVMLAVVSSWAAPIDDASQKTGAALVSTNFIATTAKGMWLVEYFSPYCGHCKSFAPTWSMLVDMHEHLADSSDFHFGRVDCIAQGDLCGEHKIRGYPSILLYADGKMIGQYEGDRSYELLSTYILTSAKQYRESKSSR